MKLYIFFYINIFIINYKYNNKYNFFKRKKNKNNDLIIIKTDNIGDYILFRNFLQF